ncbi:MAG: uracil phosphoribosyltransferase [Spirochaetes bacterium]|nr:uracil phosphoribosyltransferase [Spirochaetota bacterium]
MTVEIVDHPLVQHKLSRLRDKGTPPADFRRILGEITLILFTYASRHLPLTDTVVNTPLAKSGSRILKDDLLLVPILRAGLGMLTPILSLVPNARVEFMGLRRDESTLEPIQYYSHLTEKNSEMYAFILDPMVATGGSVLYTARSMRQNGLLHVTIVSVLTSQSAASRLEKESGDERLYTACIDPELNERGFIVPGLGDAGDRIYATF